jgi:hypothetical protein
MTRTTTSRASPKGSFRQTVPSWPKKAERDGEFLDAGQWIILVGSGWRMARKNVRSQAPFWQHARAIWVPALCAPRALCTDGSWQRNSRKRASGSRRADEGLDKAGTHMGGMGAGDRQIAPIRARLSALMPGTDVLPTFVGPFCRVAALGPSPWTPVDLPCQAPALSSVVLWMLTRCLALTPEGEQLTDTPVAGRVVSVLVVPTKPAQGLYLLRARYSLLLSYHQDSPSAGVTA